MAYNFNILTTSLSVLHNSFDRLYKIFLDLHLAKGLDILAKWFFLLCIFTQLEIKVLIFVNAQFYIFLL